MTTTIMLDAEQRRARAEQKIWLLDRIHPLDILIGHAEKFGGNLAEPGVGKPTFDTTMQRLDRIDDLLRVQPAIFRHSLVHRQSRD